ncbi:hypothetical protein BJF90_09200 [Pseudonocardia sp. CNS-004]|nr:hypothetical protein BJF90_09200 [Pseudonocardia sp. CNS-004]
MRCVRRGWPGVGAIGVGVTMLTANPLFGTAAGVVVAAALLVRALRVGGVHDDGRDGAGNQDLLTGRPGLFLLVMAAALTGGVITAAVTALTGNPLVGIAAGVYSNAVSVTGMGLGVNEILARYLPKEKQALALTAISLVRALGNIAGALAAGPTFTGAVPFLPTGWTGVAVQNLVPGLVAFGAAIVLWRRTAGSPSGAQSSSGIPQATASWRDRLRGTSRTRTAGNAALVMIGVAGAAVASMFFSGLVGVLGAVAAGVVSPVLLMLLHHVWAHGPPWVRRVVKVVAVAVAVLVMSGPAAHAVTGMPESAPAAELGLTAVKAAGGAVVLVAAFVVAVVLTRKFLLAPGRGRRARTGASVRCGRPGVDRRRLGRVRLRGAALGRDGAAGLLLTHQAADGTQFVLLQHRSAANQHAGTWGLPGGARDPGEPALVAAIRETEEEARIGADQYDVVGRYVDDHGNWTYTWVHAVATSKPEPTADAESIELRWVPLHEVEQRPLHPGFAAGWPRARAALLDRDTGQVRAVHVLLGFAVAAMVALHLLAAAEMSVTKTVSEYVVTAAGAVLVPAAMVAVGAAAALVAIMAGKSGVRRARLVQALLALIAPAMALMALSPAVPAGGVSHGLHLAAFGLAAVGVRVSSFLLAGQLRASRWMWPAAWAGSIGTLWLLVAARVMEEPEQISWLLSVGIAERIVLAVDLVVLALAAHHLGRDPRSAAGGAVPADAERGSWSARTAARVPLVVGGALWSLIATSAPAWGSTAAGAATVGDAAAVLVGVAVVGAMLAVWWWIARSVVRWLVAQLRALAWWRTPRAGSPGSADSQDDTRVDVMRRARAAFGPVHEAMTELMRSRLRMTAEVVLRLVDQGDAGTGTAVVERRGGHDPEVEARVVALLETPFGPEASETSRFLEAWRLGEQIRLLVHLDEQHPGATWYELQAAFHNLAEDLGMAKLQADIAAKDALARRIDVEILAELLLVRATAEVRWAMADTEHIDKAEDDPLRGLLDHLGHAHERRLAAIEELLIVGPSQEDRPIIEALDIYRSKVDAGFGHRAREAASASDGVGDLHDRRWSQRARLWRLIVGIVVLTAVLVVAPAGAAAAMGGVAGLSVAAPSVLVTGGLVVASIGLGQAWKRPGVRWSVRVVLTVAGVAVVVMLAVPAAAVVPGVATTAGGADAGAWVDAAVTVGGLVTVVLGWFARRAAGRLGRVWALVRLVRHLRRVAQAGVLVTDMIRAAHDTRALVAEGLSDEHRGWLRWLHERAPAGSDATAVIAEAVGVDPSYVAALLNAGVRAASPPFTSRSTAYASTSAFLRAAERVGLLIAKSIPTDVRDVVAADGSLAAARTALAADLEHALDEMALAGMHGGFADGLLRRAAESDDLAARMARAERALWTFAGGSRPLTTRRPLIVLAGAVAATVAGVGALLDVSVVGAFAVAAIGAVAAAAIIGTRLLRWVRDVRAPPSAGRPRALGEIATSLTPSRMKPFAVIVVGLAAGGLAGVDPVGVWRVVTDLATAAREWLDNPLVPGYKIVVGALASYLAFRSVLRLQTSNQEKLHERNPRQDAFVSAVASGTVTIAYTLLQPVVLAGGLPGIGGVLVVLVAAGVGVVMVVRHAWKLGMVRWGRVALGTTVTALVGGAIVSGDLVVVAAAVVVGLASAAQRKATNRARIMLGVSAGLWALPVTLVTNALNATAGPDTVLEFLVEALVSAAVAVPGPLLAVKVINWLGKRGQAAAARERQALQEKQKNQALTKREAKRLQWVLGRQLDYLSFRSPDWPAELLKWDGLLAGFFAYVLAAPTWATWWALDPLWELMVEAVIAFVLLARLNKWRDELEMSTDHYGGTSSHKIREWYRARKGLLPGRGDRVVAAATDGFASAVSELLGLLGDLRAGVALSELTEVERKRLAERLVGMLAGASRPR